MIEIKEAIRPTALQFLEVFCREIRETRSPNQIIGRRGNEYIKRWMLARKNLIPQIDDPFHTAEEAKKVLWVPSELENIYIHEYVRPDADKPHCHPWPNVSLVVSGWYAEDIYDQSEFLYSTIRYPGDVVIRGSEECHAITDVEPGTVSIFLTLKKERDWGFWTDEGFMPWENFTKDD